MYGFFKTLVFIFITTLQLHSIDSFIPANIIKETIALSKEVITLTKASETLTHGEITKRGVIRSVAIYFHEKSASEGKSTKVDLEKEYLNVKSLYYDQYGHWYCKTKLGELIEDELVDAVRSVDFDKTTKDLPYAHFDGETFQQSNERVIKFQRDIFDTLAAKQYKEARQLIGEILHTIQDFYSHSNWVEMGNQAINLDIGKESLAQLPQVSSTDDNLCNNECEEVEIQCNVLVNVFVQFLQTVGFKSTFVECPIKYFICKQNILVNDKLVSGYYSNQKLPDGTPYDKPQNYIKCSHGGILDASSFQPAQGGINKDSGFYMFSPHAYLHLVAANLAVNHTAHFFNEIRKQIGNDEFAKLLQLDSKRNWYDRLFKNDLICGSSAQGPSFIICLFCILLAVLLF
jgi:hypothetical protein